MKCDYGQSPWTTDNIWRSLNKIAKLTKTVTDKLTMKKYWKKLLNVLMKLLKLKRTIFLRWAKKLEDSHAAYWTILNSLICNKKIPVIPPLFVDGKFIWGFCEKANIFNNYFASICVPIKNESAPPHFSYKTNTKWIVLRLPKVIYYQ